MNTLKYILDKFSLKYNEQTQLPIEIPNVSRNDLIDWLHELDFKTGVEIGTYEGEYSEIICKVNPQMKLYTVDCWEVYEDYKDFTDHKVLDRLFEKAKKRLSVYTNCEIIKAFSVEALTRFSDNSLDFVYIDANHQDPYITQDITEWYRKIKPGGIISGHDYVRIRSAATNKEWDVRSAVNKYVNDNNIRPWFLLGLTAKKPGLVRERYRSWMWVKN